MKVKALRPGPSAILRTGALKRTPVTRSGYEPLQGIEKGGSLSIVDSGAPLPGVGASQFGRCSSRSERLSVLLDPGAAGTSSAALKAFEGP